ncbi:MAG: DoxX family membrane protein [Deltaproteobacteria bacterium]|nr:DoxX family membrane protein [Deltaproteobacteria bacterium]
MARVTPWIALAARLYLGAVFIAACLHKIAHPYAFAVDVATYGILPLALVNPTALVLPWVELAAGGMLVIGLRVRAAALLVAGMMVVFMVALGVALARGLDISCGCFASSGAEADPISWLTMARDGAWLALAVLVIVADRAPIGLDRWIGRRDSR